MNGSDTCAWVVDILPEYLAGRVSESESERVREHLESCAECRDRANAVSLLQQTPVPRPDPDRWDGFVEGVVTQTGSARKPRAPAKRSRALPALAAAAVITLLAVAVVLNRGMRNVDLTADAHLEFLAREVAALPEDEAAAWTAGLAPSTGVPTLDADAITPAELEKLFKEVGRS